MQRYGIERGDVLLSLQLALTREEEVLTNLGAAPRDGQSGAHVGNGAGHKAPANGASSAPQGRHVVTPVPVPRPAPAPRPLPSPPAPPRPIVMLDPHTGAGTMAALRRDLALQQAATGRPQGKVVGLEIETLDQFRLVLGPRAAEEVIRGVVEVAPFALQARDRVYRFGQDKLILWLGGGKESEVEKARSGLEGAVARFLADRGFPEVRLVAHPLDPAAISR